MSRAKAYTKMILDRLHKKAEPDKLHSNTSSNQKTQATPSDLNPKQPRAFFDHFDTYCAVYHEPVPSLPNRKPLRRPIYSSLMELQQTQRLNSEPPVSMFQVNLHKRGITRVSKETREKSMYCRKQEQHIKFVYNPPTFNRYRSLKTLPSRNIDTNRRVLVDPQPFVPLDRRDSIDRHSKLDKKPYSPRPELLRRCDSYERYILGKP